MQIEWKIRRLDEGDVYDRRHPECLLEIAGRLTIAGERAGLVTGYYVFADPVDSNLSFWELWDMEARTCELFEELQRPEPGQGGLREPLPRLLEERPGLLCIETLLLRPPFRGRGLGQAFLRETVRRCADDRVGAVVLKCEPLQYCRVEEWSDAPASEDASVLDALPRHGPERDGAKLRQHLRSWGMHRLPETRYMVASPHRLCDRLAPGWPPCVVQEFGNTCPVCGERIDFLNDEWVAAGSAVTHSDCHPASDGDGEQDEEENEEKDIPF